MKVRRCAPGELAGHEDVMVRAFAAGATRAWQADGAVGLVALDAELRVPMLLGVGPDAGAAEVVAYAARDGDVPDQVTVPRGAMPLLPSWLRPESVDDWVWRSLAVPPPLQPGEERVTWLTPDDHDDLTALIREAAPGSSIWPGDPAARRWAGIRDVDGLRACLADTSGVPGVGHVSGIATSPHTRGRGHARAITAWAARRILAEGASLVTLGVYADNAPAARLYDRLGFGADHRMNSGDIPGDHRQ